MAAATEEDIVTGSPPDAEESEEEDENSWMPFPPGDGDERSLGPVVLTPAHTVQKMIDLLHVDATHRVYDLGAGDGELLLAFAAQSGAQCVGWELKEELVENANRMAGKREIADKVHFVAEDLMDADMVLGEDTIIIVFLTPWAMQLLTDRLAEALRARCRVISCWWPVEELVKRVGCQSEELWGNTYLYSMP